MKTINQINYSFSEEVENLNEIISQMAKTLNEFKEKEAIRYKSLLDSILERDIRIQELEELNENLETRISKLSNTQLSQFEIDSISEMTTQNNALKVNLKNLTSKVTELEEAKSNLSLKGNFEYFYDCWFFGLFTI